MSTETTPTNNQYQKLPAIGSEAEKEKFHKLLLGTIDTLDDETRKKILSILKDSELGRKTSFDESDIPTIKEIIQIAIPDARFKDETVESDEDSNIDAVTTTGLIAPKSAAAAGTVVLSAGRRGAISSVAPVPTATSGSSAQTVFNLNQDQLDAEADRIADRLKKLKSTKASKPAVSSTEAKGLSSKVPSGISSKPTGAVPGDPTNPAALNNLDSNNAHNDEEIEYPRSQVEKYLQTVADLRGEFDQANEPYKGKIKETFSGENATLRRAYLAALNTIKKNLEKLEQQSAGSAKIIVEQSIIDKIDDGFQKLYESKDLVFKVLENPKLDTSPDNSDRPVSEVDLQNHKITEAVLARRELRVTFKQKKEEYRNMLKFAADNPKDKEAQEKLKQFEADFLEVRKEYGAAMQEAILARAARKIAESSDNPDLQSKLQKLNKVLEEASLLNTNPEAKKARLALAEGIIERMRKLTGDSKTIKSLDDFDVQANRFDRRLKTGLVLEPANMKLEAEKTMLTDDDKNKLLEKTKEMFNRHKGKLKVAGYGVMVGAVALSGVGAGAAAGSLLVGAAAGGATGASLMVRKIVAGAVVSGTMAVGAVAGRAAGGAYGNRRYKQANKTFDTIKSTKFSVDGIESESAAYYKKAGQLERAAAWRKRATVGGAAIGAGVGAFLVFEADVASNVENSINNLLSISEDLDVTINPHPLEVQRFIPAAETETIDPHPPQVDRLIDLDTATLQTPAPISSEAESSYNVELEPNPIFAATEGPTSPSKSFPPHRQLNDIGTSEVNYGLSQPDASVDQAIKKTEPVLDNYDAVPEANSIEVRKLSLETFGVEPTDKKITLPKEINGKYSLWNIAEGDLVPGTDKVPVSIPQPEAFAMAESNGKLRQLIAEVVNEIERNPEARAALGMRVDGNPNEWLHASTDRKPSQFNVDAYDRLAKIVGVRCGILDESVLHYEAEVAKEVPVVIPVEKVVSESVLKGPDSSVVVDRETVLATEQANMINVVSETASKTAGPDDGFRAGQEVNNAVTAADASPKVAGIAGDVPPIGGSTLGASEAMVLPAQEINIYSEYALTNNLEAVRTGSITPEQFAEAYGFTSGEIYSFEDGVVALYGEVSNPVAGGELLLPGLDKVGGIYKLFIYPNGIVEIVGDGMLAGEIDPRFMGVTGANEIVADANTGEVITLQSANGIKGLGNLAPELRDAEAYSLFMNRTGNLEINGGRDGLINLLFETNEKIEGLYYNSSGILLDVKPVGKNWLTAEEFFAANPQHEISNNGAEIVSAPKVEGISPDLSLNEPVASAERSFVLDAAAIEGFKTYLNDGIFDTFKSMPEPMQQRLLEELDERAKAYEINVNDTAQSEAASKLFDTIVQRVNIVETVSNYFEKVADGFETPEFIKLLNERTSNVLDTVESMPAQVQEFIMKLNSQGVLKTGYTLLESLEEAIENEQLTLKGDTLEIVKPRVFIDSTDTYTFGPR